MHKKSIMKRIRLPFIDLYKKSSLLFALLIIISHTGIAQTTFSTVANAVNTGGNCYTLTTAAQSQKGAVWYNNKIDLNYNFDISFSLNFGNNQGYSAGDGMAFVLQPVNTAQIGYDGSAKGYGNTYKTDGSIDIPGISPSIDIEYDTYDDFGGTTAYTALLLNGDYRRSPANTGVGQVPIGFVNNGLYHTSRVTWNVNTKTMTLYFDGVQKFTYARDIISTLFSGQNLVYFGFTAATGSSVNQQSVCFDAANSSFVNGLISPLASTTISSNATCHGAANGKATVTVSGGVTPYRISVDGVVVANNFSGAYYTINNLLPGNHTITATDAVSGTSTNSVFISEPALPVITASGPTTFCAGGSVDLSASAAGKSLQFNSLGKYVEAPSTPAISLTNALTVEAWVKTDLTDRPQYIVSKGRDDLMNGQYGILIIGNIFQFHLYQTGHKGVNSNTTIQPGVWYHVAGTWDGVTAKIYVNGVLDNSAPFIGTLTPNAQALEIGRIGVVNGNCGCTIDYQFYGEIDEIRIWNNVRTATEINNNKNLTVSVNPALVAYYQFDEGSGSLASDAANGNTATLLDAVSPPQWMVSGAPINYATYAWSPGGATTNPLSTNVGGSYTVSVSAGGCTNTSAPIIITTVATPATITASGSLTFCSGGSVLLTANAGNAYLWSNGATTQSISVTQSGNYTVTVTNASGCSATSSAIQVTVGTITAPVADISPLPVITGECSATASAPTAKDGCGNTITGVAGGPISFNTQGNYVINWTYKDASGKQSTQTQQVIIQDITAPSINTVGDLVVTATSAAGAVVTYTAPVGTDNCSVPTTVRTAGPASGSLFPLGTTKVTYTATDAVGLTTSFSFNVTVSGIAPLVTAPADIPVNNAPGQCGAIVNFTATETTGIPASTITYSVASGSLFPIGTTTVTVTAINALGISTKTFKVTVTDIEKPKFAITTPGTATVTIPAMQTIVSSCAPAIYNFMDPLPVGSVITGIDLTYSARDQGWGFTDGPDDLYVSGTHVASSIYTHTTQTFITTFTGSIPGYVYGGNNTFNFVFTCYLGWQGFIFGGTMTIHYKSTSAPITVNNDPGKCGAAVVLTTPVVTDNCSVATLQSNAPALFPVGTTNVTWKATDANGNINTIIQTVTVTDNEAPKITAPADVNVNTDNGSNTATNVNLGAPITSDNCGAIASLTNDAPAAFPIGATTVTWTVMDTHGNSASATQIVTVVDNVPPVLRSMSLDITKNNDLGVCGAIVTYNPPVANDNGSTTIVTITEGGGDNLITFNTQLTYNVSSLDFISSGQIQDIVHGHGVDISVGIELYNPQNGTWTRVQTIQTGTGDYHFGGTAAKFAAISQVSKIRFVISQPVYAAFHVYDLTINLNSINVIQTGGLPSGSLFPIGTTINTFKAIDLSGNFATSSFTVTINDAEKPVITNYTGSTHNADAFGSWTGSASTILIKDNCPSSLSVTEQYFDQRGNRFYNGHVTVVSGNYVLGTKTFPLGVNTVSVTATDAAGNISDAAKFTVTVLDVTNPTIVASGNINQASDPGVCGAYVKVPVPVTNDNCSIQSVVNSFNGGPGASGRYPVGTTILTWTVTDGSGNKTTATQTITITDNEPPLIINLPVPIIQTNDAGICGAVVTWAPVRATDNCGLLSFKSDHQSGETFQFGVTTVTFTAIDKNNNTSTASFTINITDNEAPKVITKPTTVMLVNGSANILPSDINNGSFDNCGAVSLSLSRTNFTCANTGINQVTLTATDSHGNSSSATAIVNVVGEVPTSSILVTPSNTVYTGGVPTDIYLGYGPQSVTITANVLGITPITYSWTGGAGLNCVSCPNPVFTPIAAGSYTFTVTATNKYGCSTTSTVSICVRDIHVTATANSKVYVCHTDLTTGVAQTLTLAVNAVANQLTLNPQDVLGSCGMPPCTVSTGIGSSIISNPVSGTVVNNITKEESTVEAGEGVLSVTVSPNPSATVFTLKIHTQKKIPVHVRLIDESGRIVEGRDNAPVGTAFTMGAKLITGMYFAEILQGKERVVVKLIKQNR